MRALELIEKKRNGGRLGREEIRFLIDGYVRGEIPDYQVSALLMAVYFRDMTEAETLHLTEAMTDSGARVEFPEIDGFVADKHSTGGVGDNVSLVLVPLVAAAGLYIGKLSGRGLGHTGGTIDKLESIPGFRAQLSLSRFRTLVQRHRLAIAESGDEVAPADHKLYGLRDVTATVDSIPLIVGSILSKKLAVASHGIAFDVKTGAGAILREDDRMAELAEFLVGTAWEAGRKAVALLTDMSQPLGLMVGNALELREAIEVLEGGGPDDLREICLRLGSELLLMAGKVPTVEQGVDRLGRLLQSGEALGRLRAMIESQHGDPRVVDAPAMLPRASQRLPVEAPRSGSVVGLNARAIGMAAQRLGAGRVSKNGPIDHAVGVELKAKVGDDVEEGQALAYVHANERASLDGVRELIGSAFRIADQPSERPLLVQQRLV